MKTITIIQGHPDGEGEHFCHAIADRYEHGATAAGHKVHHLDISKLQFQLLRSKHEHEHGEVAADIERAQTYIKESDHLVIIFPLWLGGMPALLKGFLEQVLRPGFAYDLKKGFFKGRLLRNKSARIIVTMGMPAWVYKWFFCAHSLKNLKRNILEFTGIKPIKTTLIGTIESSGINHEKWLQKVNNLGQKAK